MNKFVYLCIFSLMIGLTPAYVLADIPQKNLNTFGFTNLDFPGGNMQAGNFDDSRTGPVPDDIVERFIALLEENNIDFSLLRRAFYNNDQDSIRAIMDKYHYLLPEPDTTRTNSQGTSGYMKTGYQSTSGIYYPVSSAQRGFLSSGPVSPGFTGLDTPLSMMSTGAGIISNSLLGN